MPWCPICKNEYREGFTVCSECKVPLVDTISDDSTKKLCVFDNDDIKEKFMKYLDYSKIPFSTVDLEEKEYLCCEPGDLKRAEKALKAFVNVEEGLTLKKQIDSTYIVYSSEEIMQELMEQVDGESEEEKTAEIEKEMRAALTAASEPSIYESKKAKAEEFSGSGYMLIIIGVAGVIYILLNIFGVLHTVNGLFSELLMSAMFLGLIAGGFYSLRSSRKYEEDAVEEEKLTNSLNEWLKNYLDKKSIEAFDEEGNSAEENYLLRIDGIKSKMKNDLPELASINENYLDSLVEDYYNSIFGEN